MHTGRNGTHCKDEYKVVQQARDAFNTFKTLGYSYRYQQLLQLRKLLLENKDVVVDSLHQDIRKPKFESDVIEFTLVWEEVNHAIKNLHKWMKPNRMNKKAILPWNSAYTESQPYGVVLIIGSWNFPYATMLMPLVGAIAAGNCVVIKPSEVSPVSSRCLSQLVQKYLDKECYYVVEGGAAEATELLNQKFDYIFYTGSKRVGQIVLQAASLNVTPVTVELGGKCPAYIDDTVNLEASLRRIIWAKCINLGQTCIATDYLLCSTLIANEIMKYAPKIIKEFFGDYPQDSPYLSRIITDKHMKRLQNLLNSTKGRVLVGGRMDVCDRWIEPTLIFDVDDNDPLMEEEIFGPLLPIIQVKSADEAIDFIKRRPKPLAIYLFSNKTEVQKKFRAQTSSGQLVINDSGGQFLVYDLPFGGVGASGYGKYKGINTFHTFSHQRSIILRGIGAFDEHLSRLRYPPYNNELNVKIIKFGVWSLSVFTSLFTGETLCLSLMAALFISVGILIGLFVI